MKYTATDKTAKEKTKSKNIKTRVIPGYHLSLGIVVTMLSVIVLIPLASVLVIKAFLTFSFMISATKSPGDIFSEYTSTDANGMRTMTESIVTTIPSERYRRAILWHLL